MFPLKTRWLGKRRNAGGRGKTEDGGRRTEDGGGTTGPRRFRGLKPHGYRHEVAMRPGPASAARGRWTITGTPGPNVGLALGTRPTGVADFDHGSHGWHGCGKDISNSEADGRHQREMRDWEPGAWTAGGRGAKKIAASMRMRVRRRVRRRMEDGGWRMEDGGWKMEDGRCRMSG